MEARPIAQGFPASADRLGVSQSGLINHTVCCTQAGKGCLFMILKPQLAPRQRPMPGLSVEGYGLQNT